MNKSNIPIPTRVIINHALSYPEEEDQELQHQDQQEDEEQDQEDLEKHQDQEEHHDLFAGPRTSLFFDSTTGQLLSSTHTVSNMDALINSLEPSTLPNELLNMHRETGERSNLTISSQLPFPTIPFPHTHTNHSLIRNPKLISYPPINLHTTQRSKLPLSYSHSQLPTLPPTLHAQPRLPLPYLQRPSPYSQPPSIPSIHQIVQKYSSQLSQSSIPLKPSSSLRKKSIATRFIHPDSPPPRPSTTHQFYQRHVHSSKLNSLQSSSLSSSPTTTTHPIKLSTHSSSTNHSISPSKARSETPSDNESTSSIHSLTREALKLPQLPTPNCDSSTSSLNPQSPPRFKTRFNHDQNQRPDSDSISKDSKNTRSSTLDSALPSSPKIYTQAEADDHIARYLRSSRLTTLIKLERQQSPMTVSLADVGSSTGRPVIVYLGLGCVRYLVGLYDELAEALGLRLICIDRWGLGKTTEVPDDQRSFTEWASVVEEVADHLGIEKFSILAHSAGAPYALASSLRFLERVHGSIHLLAPWVSINAEGGGMDVGAYKWLRYIPNSMIKTVQTAEWKMTGWRLGKLPKLNYPPVGFDARTPPTPSTSSNQSFERKSSSDSSSDYPNSKSQPTTPHLKRCPTLVVGSGTGNNNHKPMFKENYKSPKGLVPTCTSSSSSTTTTTTTINNNISTIATRRKLRDTPGERIDKLDLLIVHPDRAMKEEKKTKIIHNPNNKKKTNPTHPSSFRPSQQDNRDLNSFTCSSTVTTVVTKEEMKNKKNSVDSRSDISMDLTPDAFASTSGSSTAKPPLDLSRVTSNTSHYTTRSDSILLKSVRNDTDNNQAVDKTRNDSGIGKHKKAKNGASSLVTSQYGTKQPPNQSKERVDKQEETSGTGMGGIKRTLGISLLRASYSESLKGGASDLIKILERDSKKKPWGFKYSEINKPVKIWHGDKDEKISLRGSEMFINSIVFGRIKFYSKIICVKDGDHSLMTNVDVIFQVFESISDEWSNPPPF